LSSNGLPLDIFFAESLAVACAVELAIQRKWRRLVVFTDSMNTVDLFSNHAPPPLLRPLLRHVILQALKSGLDFKVHHVAGERNVVADAASRGLLDEVRRMAPHASIGRFNPPAVLLGGQQR
jgi:hypothetical protein